MVSPNAVRCINRARNKVQFFSKHLVNDPRWRKMTGYEPQPLDNDPSQGITTEKIKDFYQSVDSITPPLNIEDEVQKRVAAELAKHNLTGDIGASVEVKPKRKYTKKKA